MHAVGGVDLKAWYFIDHNHFVHTRGAVALGGLAKLGQMRFNRNRRIGQFQMTRLVLFMLRAGQKD